MPGRRSGAAKKEQARKKARGRDGGKPCVETIDPGANRHGRQSRLRLRVTVTRGFLPKGWPLGQTPSPALDLTPPAVAGKLLPVPGNAAALDEAIKDAGQALDRDIGPVADAVDQHEVIALVGAVGINDIAEPDVAGDDWRLDKGGVEAPELAAHGLAHPARLSQRAQRLGIAAVALALRLHNQAGTEIGLGEADYLLQKPRRVWIVGKEQNMLAQFAHDAVMDMVFARGTERGGQMAVNVGPDDFDEKRGIAGMNKDPVFGAGRKPVVGIKVQNHRDFFSQRGRSLGYCAALGMLMLFSSPALADCQGDIARFQKLLDGDLKTGFVGKEVHAKATDELKAASALCKGGQDAAASQAVVSTRVRHGYPAGLTQNLTQ